MGAFSTRTIKSMIRGKRRGAADDAADTADERLARAGARVWRVSWPVVVSVGVHVAAIAVTARVVYTLVQPPAEPESRDIFLSAELVSADPVKPVKPVANNGVNHAASAAAVAPAETDDAKPRPIVAQGDVMAPLARGGPSPADVTAALTSKAGGVTFAGLTATGSRARSVVYVVDCSGPMVTSWREVAAELERSVGALSPTQRFSVVLFRDQSAANRAGNTAGDGANVASANERRLIFEPRLVDATARNRDRLAAFIAAAQPGGRSNPLEGLRAAIALRPQVIFLLSRSITRSEGGSWDLGRERTLAELDRLNPRDPANGQRPVIIKTIQFIDNDPTGIMQAIGREHGSGGAAADDFRVLDAGQIGK